MDKEEMLKEFDLYKQKKEVLEQEVQAAQNKVNDLYNQRTDWLRG
jgi:hypothetical protein